MGQTQKTKKMNTIPTISATEAKKLISSYHAWPSEKLADVKVTKDGVKTCHEVVLYNHNGPEKVIDGHFLYWQ